MREDRLRRGHYGKCGVPGQCCDHLKGRLFGFVPLWSIPVVLFYARRRIIRPRVRRPCRAPQLGPWEVSGNRDFDVVPVDVGEGDIWLKVSKRFDVSWHKVYNVPGVRAIDVDEIAYGHEKVPEPCVLV